MHKIGEKFISSARELKKVRAIVLTAMFIALKLVLDLLNLRITLSQDLRITFGFLAMAMIGMLFGPVVGMIAGLAGDVLGYLVNQGGGAYFPGFAVTAVLGGLVWGICLYKTSFKWWKFLISKGIINIFLNIGLNTLWLYIMYGPSVLATFPLRVFKNTAILPIEVIMVIAVGKIVFEAYKRSFKTV